MSTKASALTGHHSTRRIMSAAPALLVPFATPADARRAAHLPHQLIL
ncbi:MAG TPA: hypothetical protein VF510_00520 [Ktedonobacterales bacterium]